MGWLIFLGILLLLGCLPLGLRLKYDEAGFRAFLLAGRIRIPIYPVPSWLKKRRKKPEKQQVAPKTQSASQRQPQQKAPSGGRLEKFLPFVKLGLSVLSDLRRKLRVENLMVHLILAGEDPCDLAVNYGRAWAALGNLMPQLERALVIRKRDVEVECDFLAEEIKVLFAMDVTITLGRLLGLVLGAGFKMTKQFMNMKKAVQTNE